MKREIEVLFGLRHLRSPEALKYILTLTLFQVQYLRLHILSVVE